MIDQFTAPASAGAYKEMEDFMKVRIKKEFIEGDTLFCRDDIVTNSFFYSDLMQKLVTRHIFDIELLTGKTVRKALLQSIFGKWEAILSCKKPDKGHRDCPLCQLFFDRACGGCPVFEKTGYYYCEKTPYREWTGIAGIYDTICDNEKVSYYWLGDPFNPQAIDIAVKMQEFLISLLEKEDQDNLENLYISFKKGKKNV